MSRMSRFSDTTRHFLRMVTRVARGDALDESVAAHLRQHGVELTPVRAMPPNLSMITREFYEERREQVASQLKAMGLSELPESYDAFMEEMQDLMGGQMKQPPTYKMNYPEEWSSRAVGLTVIEPSMVASLLPGMNIAVHAEDLTLNDSGQVATSYNMIRFCTQGVTDQWLGIAGLHVALEACYWAGNDEANSQQHIQELVRAKLEHRPPVPDVDRILIRIEADAHLRTILDRQFENLISIAIGSFDLKKAGQSIRKRGGWDAFRKRTRQAVDHIKAEWQTDPPRSKTETVARDELLGRAIFATCLPKELLVALYLDPKMAALGDRHFIT